MLYSSSTLCPFLRGHFNFGYRGLYYFGLTRLNSPLDNRTIVRYNLDVSSSSNPRQRGGQPGNLNARKHGFYSSKFKKTDLAAFETSQFSGLSEEITFLRLYIRHFIAQSLQVDDVYQQSEILRVLSLALSTLSRLVKIDALLSSSSGGEYSAALEQALKEISEEITNGTFRTMSSRNSPPLTTPMPSEVLTSSL
jgi:hypothetical protein